MSTNIKLVEDIKNDFSGNRMKHLLGRYEHNASDFYMDFNKIEESFDYEELKYMSKLTLNILGAIDYERVRRIRNENYGFLGKQLKNKIN